MNKQPEVTEATRMRLIEAFCSFYLDRPVEKITVREVAAKAGYSRATFYNYFTDPYDLIDSVEEELVVEVISRIGEARISSDFSKAFTSSFSEVVRSNPVYLNIFLSPAGSSRLANKLKSRFLPAIASALGVDASVLQTKLALDFYIAGIVSLMGAWLGSEREASASDIAIIVDGILRDGILSQLR
ncbi:TetR/AcrR family transcriptional regulator [Adlercreutzia sp. R21]|uniref:TetR/AcrR family transcriptional regulator n=1 Tax=Adlercreutzia wanghongyangiae TaxID=3111451 RepID=UPI002DB9CBE5|nr:TetR/AcrR family transcriptional regulator [Adlercreutzia sp. R21]MEC4184832.1 TetR/AcrR family transcriptional regulator [Adlercreutzia sp. R21]